MAGVELNRDFMEHVDALRKMILRIFVTYVVWCIPCWFLSGPLLDYLMEHAVPAQFKLHYFELLEPFFTQLRLMLILALMISLPFSLYYVWQFVAPALIPSEKRFVGPLLSSSFALAVMGAAVAYFFLMPCVIRFSYSFSGPNMDPVIGIGSFVSLLTMLVLAGILLFQFPIILFIFILLGVIDVETMKRKRAVVIVLILLLAGILTPPDVLSQVLLALPTWLLYELSIAAFTFYRKHCSAEISKPDRESIE